MSQEEKVRQLEEQLHQLRCDFERFREWVQKGPYGYNYRDVESDTRVKQHGCSGD